MTMYNVKNIDDLIKKAGAGLTREELITKIIEALKHMDYDKLESISYEIFDDSFNIADRPKWMHEMTKEEMIEEAMKLSKHKDNLPNYQKERYSELISKLETIAEEELQKERNEDFISTEDVVERLNEYLYSNTEGYTL